MSNVALYIGAGYEGEDSLGKFWLRYLPENHNVFVASRINPDVSPTTENAAKTFGFGYSQERIKNAITDLKARAVSFTLIHKSPYAKQRFSSDEIVNLENWLGISFDYVSSFDRRFYDIETMSDRRNRSEVLQCLARAVLFFRDFFEDNKIDCFVTTLEDDYPSVAAFYVAQRLNVLTIGFMEGERFPKHGTMFCKDFDDLCVWSDRKIQWNEIESLYQTTTLAGKTTREEYRQHYGLSSVPQRLKSISWIAGYREYVRNIVNQNPCEQYIFEPKTLVSDVKDYGARMFRRLLIDRVAQEPDYSDRFLLFPLHYHDDAQMTFREPLLDQYDLIREVSRALPSDVCLYVKPHPHYSGIDVTFSNLSKIRSLRNVKVIKPDTPTVDLIKQSKAVITVNSTTGFEALILGIPVVTFGHDFYCKEPFCYVVRDRNAMAQTFTDALSGRHAPKREEVQEFIKTVYANQIWADEVTHDAKSEGDSYDRRRAEALDKVIGNLLRQDSPLPSLRAS